MGSIHLATGSIFFFIFLYTGLYMYFEHNQLQDMADGQRMIYRASHIYILLTSFINIMVGLSYTKATLKFSVYLQNISSVIFMGVPFILVASFFIEPNIPNLDRIYTKLAILLLLFAVILSIIQKWFDKRANNSKKM